jgi:hypothetical protein
MCVLYTGFRTRRVLSRKKERYRAPAASRAPFDATATDGDADASGWKGDTKNNAREDNLVKHTA